MDVTVGSSKVKNLVCFCFVMELCQPRKEAQDNLQKDERSQRGDLSFLSFPRCGYLRLSDPLWNKTIMEPTHMIKYDMDSPAPSHILALDLTLSQSSSYLVYPHYYSFSTSR